jgi:MoaA/NifB/PqqE/SkfB family radical SAM enzyme
MIDSTINNKVKLNRIAYVGRGEPTLNNQLPLMISYARNAIPNIIMSMDTNANQPFKEEYLNLNWINCSIDGSDQESYVKYRRNGKFERAVNFMRSGVELKRKTNSNCKIKWKYILFNTNDSDEQLGAAQNLANAIGVDELDLIITHCGSFDRSITPSKRFTNLNDLNNYIQTNKTFHQTVGSRAT